MFVSKISLHFLYCYCCQFQLTIDVAWSPACIDKRCFDYISLADIADFIFIMAYDERSQVFGPCVAWANSPFNMTLWGTFVCIYVLLILTRSLAVAKEPCIDTHTHNHFTAVWILSGTTRVSRYQKKHSPTHTHHGHQSSLSAFSIYYDT